MTADQFRKIVLSLPGAVESAHMGHPDFRIGGKIFASLGASDAEWAMVRLAPEQQQAFCSTNAEVFQPCNGAWGRQGCTNVRLSKAKTAEVRSALTLAVENLSATSGKPTKPTTTRSGKSTTSEFDDSEAVDALLRDLKHALTTLIEAIRAALLKCDRRITEGVKWNSPSFYCRGWFATFHLRSPLGVMLVLHQGAKGRKDSPLKNAIDDGENLLTWKSADRATITFADAAGFRRREKALMAIIKQWVQQQIASADET